MRTNQCIEIKLAEEDCISKVQLMKAGVYEYYDNTKMEISTDMLRNFKKNFDDNVLKIDLAIDYFHNSWQEAAGWIKSIELRAGDTELWCEVEWTEAACKKIKDKELRYLSADFTMNYRDNETGQEYGPTLNGGGLTNRPFIKGMNPILSEISALIDKQPEKLEDITRILSDRSKKREKVMDFSELKQGLVSLKLSDAEKNEVAKLIDLDANSRTLSEENKALKGQIESKDEEIKKLSDQIKDQEKEIKFSEMVTNGKAVPAQKDAFMAGDMVAFAEKSVAVNLGEGKGSGSGGKKENNGDEVKTREEAEIKLSEIVAKKRSENSSLTFSEAMKAARIENPQLNKVLMA